MVAEGNSLPLGPPLIGALLRMRLEIVRARMLEQLHDQGFDDLVPAHLQVLQWPGPDGARPSELAERLHMTKQALNYLLGQLEQLGYLKRREDPSDARSRRIVATERGRQAMRAMRAVVRGVERDWQRRLGKEGFAQLRALLVQLNDAGV
jgi:DNA-binding MarR family transcriptional regulator